MSSRALTAENLVKTYVEFRDPSHRFLQRFSKRFEPKQTPILKGIDLHLDKGEILGIVGANGAGKTTLLRVLSGIIEPTSGRLESYGRICPILDLGFGLADEMTGLENIYFVAALRGFTRRDVSRRLDQIIEFAAIGDAVNEPIQHYSAGMKMRLAYAISTHLDPEVLIIDEALAVGDEGFQHKCFEHLRQLADDGVGIILVSHSSQTIQEFCDRAMLLDQGEAIQSGKPSKVIESFHRLLFAPPEGRGDVRGTILSGKPTESQNPVSENVTPQQALYDSGITTNPTFYPDQGAVLKHITLKDKSGQCVNLVAARASYDYQYTVTFSRGFQNVRFGMLIKSMTGFEIGGSETGHIKMSVTAGETIRINFPLTCNLNPGTYYLNAGVLASVNGKETFVARVIDALKFRVLPNDFHQTGQVDFGIDPKITSLG